ncbi:MAG: envelope stress response membrane protein PspB [Sphingobium sp.]|jgi:phage shock protein B|nr:envelope stress response membrane protein PspB [Sphingobium sp.]MCI1270305.1 envelope stress response membrane protein PspB [Sphingobium sp.]MCI1754571.1 envelope stress response membrane protein PspB [Sphingobium sp.]MCI2052011.1 envelope stress response membrane protein PspB [Sphingobium sp.]
MDESFLAVPIIGIIFIGLPWVVLHYLTKWKTASSLTREDENMLDSLYDTARRLEERLITVERIVAADHPDFKPTTSGAVDTDPVAYRRSN